MAFYIVKRRLIKKIICWCWKKKVWNNKQNPVKWIFKKANRHTEVWISKYSLTYNKVCSKRCFLELLTANSGSQLRKLHTCYKELPNFCIVLERVGEVIPKSWSVKAVKKRSGAEMAGQFLWMMLQKLDAECCSHAKSWSTFVEEFIDLSLIPQAR